MNSSQATCGSISRHNPSANQAEGLYPLVLAFLWLWNQQSLVVLVGYGGNTFNPRTGDEEASGFPPVQG